VKALGHRKGAKGPQIIFKKDCSKRESNRGLARLRITTAGKATKWKNKL